MKKLFVLILAVIICLSLFACGEDDGSIIDGANLSGEKTWWPAVATYIGADGTRYDMQTIKMDGLKAEVRLYRHFQGNTIPSSGYNFDLSKTGPLEIIPVSLNAKNEMRYGLNRFTIAKDGTHILEESSYDTKDGISEKVDYDVVYDDEGRIAKVTITTNYPEDKDHVAVPEEHIYAYGENGYTITYVDQGWTGYDDDETKFMRKLCYEIPYESGDIVITETYCRNDDAVHYPDDFVTYEEQKMEKVVYKVNRQGFCVTNTIYFTNGKTETNCDFGGNMRFETEFNDAGMPTKYTTTSMDGSDPTIAYYTYDANGCLTKFQVVSDDDNYTVEITWQEVPVELNNTFAIIYDFAHFPLRRIIGNNCPMIKVGPQKFIYKKADFLK